MKITIRPLEQRDAYISWKWRNDPEVFANTVRHYSGPVTLEDELKWIKEVLARPDERRFAILADDTLSQLHYKNYGSKLSVQALIFQYS